MEKTSIDLRNAINSQAISEYTIISLAEVYKTSGATMYLIYKKLFPKEIKYRSRLTCAELKQIIEHIGIPTPDFPYALFKFQVANAYNMTAYTFRNKLYADFEFDIRKKLFYPNDLREIVRKWGPPFRDFSSIL